MILEPSQNAAAAATAAAEDIENPYIGWLEYQVGRISPSYDVHHLRPVYGTTLEMANIVVRPLTKDQATLLRRITASSRHPCPATA